MASGECLGQSLAQNSALTELRLAHNSLADPGIQAVSRSVSRLHFLRYLRLAGELLILSGPMRLLR